MRVLIDGAMVWDGSGAKPFAGKVLIDGEDIAGKTQESLRSQISMVTQVVMPRCR